MKKSIYLISILIIGFIASTFGQNYIELTFTAQNNGQYVPLESILIENLTQGVDTTLYAPDTFLLLEYDPSGMNEHNLHNANSFSVSQNYPNPFKGKTKVNLYLPVKEYIKISVWDILGRELVHYEYTLKRGNHSFTFYSAKEKYYLLTVTGNQTSKTIKMLNANSKSTYGGTCKIVFNEYEDKVINFKSQRLRRVAPALAEKSINNFVFDLGDELQYTGYANTVDGIFGSAVIVDTPQTNTDYVFSIIKGLRCPGTATVTDIDSNIYNTVQIGSQCWMKENLKTTTYQNGTPIPNVTNGSSWSNLTTGAYVWYDNNIWWKGLYGALYNWYATVDANGLCPTGWHVPTHDELTALTDFIGGTGQPHGNELKSCRQVNSPLGGSCNTTGHPRWDDSVQNGTDDYGFSGLPGGYHSSDGTLFDSLGEACNLWTSTESSSNSAWRLTILTSFSWVAVASDTDKRVGISVRCLRD